METMTVPNSQPPATPEEIWAILRESQLERQREREDARKEAELRRKEAELRRKEEALLREKEALWMEEEALRRKKADQEMKELRESLEKTGRYIDKLSKNIGGLGNSIGGVIETLFAAHLWEKFPEYDLRRSYENIKLYDENVKAIAEIDILLINTEWAMAVEVKNNAKIKDVDEHIVRMERILKYSTPLVPPQAKLLGAIAAGVVQPEAAAYAHQCGFFVLELAGESVVRVPAPPDFKPKEW